jgi:cytochrome bd-type quinol oxidase subunit 1
METVIFMIIMIIAFYTVLFVCRIGLGIAAIIRDWIEEHREFKETERSFFNHD